MPLYLTCLILSITTTAIHFTWISYIMKRRNGLASMQVLAFSHLIAAAILLFWVKDPSIILKQPAFGFSVFMLGCLMWLSRMLYYYAYSKVPVGDVSILSTFTPVFSLFFSINAGYAISLQAIIGIVLISGSIYSYFCYQQFSPSNRLRLLQPIYHIIESKPLRYTLLSTIPPAWAVVFQKRAIELSDPYATSFWACLLIGVFTLCSLTLWKQPVRIAPSHRRDLLIAGSFQAAMTVCISYFLQISQPSATQALLRLSVLLQIILAYLFLGERFKFRQHAISSLIALAGVYLILNSKFH